MAGSLPVADKIPVGASIAQSPRSEAPLNAAAEYPDPDRAVGRLIAAHRAWYTTEVWDSFSTKRA